MRLNIYSMRKHDGYIIYEESWESMLEEMHGHIYIFTEEYLKEKFKDNTLVAMNMDNTFYPPLTIEVDSYHMIINVELLK